MEERRRSHQKSSASSSDAASGGKATATKASDHQHHPDKVIDPEQHEVPPAAKAQPASQAADGPQAYEGRHQEQGRESRTRWHTATLGGSSRRSRQAVFLSYANTLAERIRIAPHLERKPIRESLLNELRDASQRYVTGGLDDTAFLILVKECEYNCMSERQLESGDIVRIARRELNQTLASDDVISDVQSRVRQLTRENKEGVFNRIRDDLVHHWQLTAETSAARGRIAAILSRIMGFFLFVYLLYPFLQALRLGIAAATVGVTSLPENAQQNGESAGLLAQQVLNSSVAYNVVVGFHKFIEVFGGFDEFKAIVLGGIGAIISIALSMDRERELNVFSVANFVPRTFGRLLTGIWAAIVMNLVFRGLFENIVNPLDGPTGGTSAEPLLLEAIRALAMFAAGFSERFFDRLMSVASTRLGVDFQLAETPNGSAAGAKQPAPPKQPGG